MPFSVYWHLLLVVFPLYLIEMSTPVMSKKISMIGGGNWGTAMARHLALGNSDDEVKMWVYEEKIDGRNLTSIINESGVNVKYLPGVRLPSNLKASSDLCAVCSDADVLFLAIPHQFLLGVLKDMNGLLKEDAIVVSLIKGLTIHEEGPQLLSTMTSNTLELRTDVVVLMGANVASDVAHDELVEASIACKDRGTAELIKSIVQKNNFVIDMLTTDVASVELCGALKNVVALAAGFCDGLGVGSSTKAAIIRKGMQEMVMFCNKFSGDSFNFETILSSCGVADVIATCFGGRNRKCAEEFARRMVLIGESNIGRERASALWEEIESEILKGQKLQGLGTCYEVITCLTSGQMDDFMLFPAIYDIAFEGNDVRSLLVGSSVLQSKL